MGCELAYRPTTTPRRPVRHSVLCWSAFNHSCVTLIRIGDVPKRHSLNNSGSGMTRVTVSPDVLRCARERAGLHVEDLVVRFPKFAAWKRGELLPTFNG